MRKMRGLYKRGNVFWMCFKVNGKLYREGTGKSTQKEAEYVLACRRKEVAEGKLPARKIIGCKFAELAKDYDTWVKKQKAYGSKKTFIRHLMEKFGDLNIDDLNTRIVEQWQTKLLKKYKPATVNRRLACLKNMYTKAVDWEMASEATLKQVRKVKFFKENNQIVRFLDVEECQRLVESCSEHLRPIVIVGLNSGMRKGEILGLKWSQVDLRHGFISLEDTKSGEGRQIPINTTLEFLFKEMPRSVESEYVFTGKAGKPLTDIKHSYQTALKKAEIYNANFHTLRHTFASQLAMAGVDITSIQALMGHKTLKMTLRYSHLSPGHKTKAVMKLDQILMKTKNANFSSQFSSQFEVETTNYLP